jgi:hypothetical protein
LLTCKNKNKGIKCGLANLKFVNRQK